MAGMEKEGKRKLFCGSGLECLELDDDVVQFYNAFHKLMRAHFKVMTNIMTDEKIHPAQVRCLLEMQELEGTFQRELAERLHIERATATVMLQKMERNGLIKRCPDENDQRMTRIFLTDYGREKAQEIKKTYAAVLNKGMLCIDVRERQQLTQVLNTVADQFNEILRYKSNAKGEVNP